LGLRLKFNLTLIAIFVAGFATVSVLAYRFLEAASIEDAKRSANVVLDSIAISNLDTRIASSIGSRLIEMKVREFTAKDAPSGIESDAAQRLLMGSAGGTSGARELAEMVAGPGGERVYVVGRVLNMPDGSPPRVRMVTIDGNNVTSTARIALTTLLSSIGIVFVIVFFVLNLMLDRLIVRPVAEMARQADAVSVGDFSVAPFVPANKDEISMLGIAFNRMRRSAEEAIQMLKGH
jgi:HAMP domain-containing protein